MDPRWMILPVVLMCAEVLVEAAAGQNATLTCSVNTTDVHWFIEISSQVKAPLARSYSGDPTESEYFVNTSFKNKYMAMGNKLVISNITAEDDRRYFCGRKNNSNIIFTDTLRLAAAVLTSLTNNAEETQQQHNCRIVHSELIIYSSFTLNVLFVFVIIGLFLTSPCLKRKNCNHQVNDPSTLTSENPETLEMPQYEEIQFRAPSPAAPHLTEECVYHKAQLPGAPLPRHH